MKDNKKLSFIVILIIISLLFMLTACNNLNIAEYKATKLTELQEYADGMAQKECYTELGLQSIAMAVSNGKKTIDSMRKKKTVDMAVQSVKDEIDSVEMKVGSMNGAYFVAENNKQYAIVKNNLITISVAVPASQASAENIISDTFEFSFIDGFYIGNNARKTIRFKFKNLKSDLIVYITLNNLEVTTFSFTKDSSKTIFNGSTINLDAPKDIKINNTGLMWIPNDLISNAEPASALLYSKGILGIGIEVMTEGQESFVLISIKDFSAEPICMFTVYLPDLNLSQGTHTIRVFYLGGSFLSDNLIKTSENSLPVVFKVILNAQGTYTIIEN